MDDDDEEGGHPPHHHQSPSDDAALPVPTSVSVSLEQIRTRHQALASNEEVTKSAALEMMRLFHQMETMLLRVLLQRELADAATKTARMLDSLASDIAHLNRTTSELAASLAVTQSRVQEMVAATTTTTKGRR